MMATCDHNVAIYGYEMAIYRHKRHYNSHSWTILSVHRVASNRCGVPPPNTNLAREIALLNKAPMHKMR